MRFEDIPEEDYPKYHIRVLPRWHRILKSPLTGWYLWRLGHRREAPAFTLWQCVKLAYEVAAAKYGEEKNGNS